MMPALIRAYGAALTTSRALPTPGRGQWPLHPQTRPKHREGVHGLLGREVPPCWPGVRVPRMRDAVLISSLGSDLTLAEAAARVSPHKLQRHHPRPCKRLTCPAGIGFRA